MPEFLLFSICVIFFFIGVSMALTVKNDQPGWFGLAIGLLILVSWPIDLLWKYVG